MGKKIIYDEYNIRHKGRDFRIFEHDIKNIEVGVSTEEHRWEDCNYIDGNRSLLHMFGDVAITMLHEPSAMVYVPLRKAVQLSNAYDKLDLLFYTHKIQFNRSWWIEIRSKMQKSHARKHVIRYDTDYSHSYADKISRMHHKREASWKKKSGWRIWYKNYDTMFVESSQVLYAEDIMVIEDFNKRPLEEELMEFHGVPCKWMLGMEYGFVTKKIFQEKFGK